MSGALKGGDLEDGAPKGGPQTQKNGAPRGWGPEGLGPEGWGPEGLEGPKFRAFFFLPPQCFFFLSSLGCLLVEFWWCLKRRDPQMCPFGVLGLSCETPAEVQRPHQQLTQVNFTQRECQVTVGSTATPTETRRFHVFMPKVNEWMSDRQMYIQEDREGQCGRGGQVVEVCGPSSDKFATSPHLHGGAICPNGREFFCEFSEWSVSTESSGTGAEWERQTTHRNHCCGDEALSHSQPFGMWFPKWNGLRCPQL